MEIFWIVIRGTNVVAMIIGWAVIAWIACFSVLELLQKFTELKVSDEEVFQTLKSPMDFDQLCHQLTKKYPGKEIFSYRLGSVSHSRILEQVRKMIKINAIRIEASEGKLILHPQP